MKTNPSPFTDLSEAVERFLKFIEGPFDPFAEGGIDSLNIAIEELTVAHVHAQNDAEAATSLTPSDALEAHDRDLAERVATAVIHAEFDPGAYVPRDEEFREGLSLWQHRARKVAIARALEGGK